MEWMLATTNAHKKEEFEQLLDKYHTLFIHLN